MTSTGFFFTQCLSDSGAIRNSCRQDWLKSHEGGTEDEFKVYWLGLPEEEIMVRVVASFFFRYIHHFVSIPVVETGGFCEGMSNLVSVLKKTN